MPKQSISKKAKGDFGEPLRIELPGPIGHERTPASADCEALVSELLADSSVAGSAQKRRVIEWPIQHPPLAPQIYCAYNQTRGQSLCEHLELADLSSESLREHIATLTPGCNSALWLSPFHGISPDQVESPIDLVFLDRNHFVIAVVEKFPIYEPTSSCLPAGSVLALPPQTITTSGILPGDQLVICTPEKMKRRLKNSTASATGILQQQSISHNLYSFSLDLSRLQEAPAQLTSWEEILNQPRSVESPRDQAEHFAPPPVPASESSLLAHSFAQGRKNPLLCLLTLQSCDFRKFPRESMPWVAASFYSGGSLAPTLVRNISLSGMFIPTEKRWEPGTIVHVTLNDWRLPSPERSISVNAMAVRSTDDGVGLRFIFSKPGAYTALNLNDAQPIDVTKKQLKGFLHQFKTVNHPPIGWPRFFRYHG